MRGATRYSTALLSLLLLAAAPSPVTQPIEFEGDTMDVDRQAGVVRLTGNVQVVHGPTTIRSQQMEIRYGPDGETVERLIATGNVRLTEAGRKGRAERAEYEPDRQRLVLEGRPTIWEGQDRLTGDRIVLLQNPERVQVTGARAVLQPERVRQSLPATKPAK